MPIGLADRIAGYVTEAYKSVPRRGAEAGGLLLGGVRLGPVIDIFVTGFHPVPCDYVSGPSFTISDAVQTEFRAAVARYPAAEILGYYRSHTRKATGLDSSDQELIDRIFPGLSGLVLLIKPSGVSTFRGSYFFFQNGRLETRPVGPEFPFLVTVPGGVPPPSTADPEEAPPDPPAATPPPPETAPSTPAFREMLQESLNLDPEPAAPLPVAPAAAPVSEHTKRRERLQWEIVAAGLMIVAALGLLWWQYRGASGEDDSPSSNTPSHVASLGLAVQPGVGGWRITWDPASLPARTSVRGALDVTEDDSHESIPLTAAQIREGAATYRPIGDDITFRLDLVARDSSLASETYRVLLKPRETEAAAPRTPAPAIVKRTPPPETTEKPAPKTEKPAPKPEAPADGAYVESEVVSRVAPEVPEGIRPRITAPLSIDVRVAIDRQGHVTRATAVQHEDGLVDYLAKRAVAAARRWTFAPAKRAGKPVDSTRTIHFVFEQ